MKYFFYYYNNNKRRRRRMKELNGTDGGVIHLYYIYKQQLAKTYFIIIQEMLRIVNRSFFVFFRETHDH